jgi:hypothetical protein
MNNTNQQIPAEWLVCNFYFRLFTAFEKKTVPTSEHQVRFIPAGDFDSKREIAEMFDNGIMLDEFNQIKDINYILIVKLGGTFYSVDKIVFDNLLADNNGLYIHLKYIQVESLDGDPFEVDPFILIPFDPSFKMMSIDFRAFKKSFSTSQEEEVNINIPRLELNFISKKQ